MTKGTSDRSSARGPRPQVPQWHPRVAKRASIGTLVRGPSTEALLGQGHVPKGRESVPLQGLRSGSRPGLARHTRLQVVLRHPGVAKGASDRSSAREPCPQMPQWHPRVAKEASSARQKSHPPGKRVILSIIPSHPTRQKSHPAHQEGSSRPPKGSFCPSGESFCPSGWSFCQHIHAEGGIFGNGI